MVKRLNNLPASRINSTCDAIRDLSSVLHVDVVRELISTALPIASDNAKV